MRVIKNIMIYDEIHGEISVTADVVIDSMEDNSIDTGILDQKSRKIYRRRQSIGFDLNK